MESSRSIRFKSWMTAKSRSLRIALRLVITIALLGACAPVPGATQPATPRPTLTVLAANMSNVFRDLKGGTIIWQTKADRFANLIIGTGVVPDIISMTESTGWSYCGGDTTGDYDIVDRIISDLKNSTGVTYRIAYMVGVEGTVGGHLGLCKYFSGDTVLYNPTRITNITPADGLGSGWPQVAHNATNVIGIQVRRSLPLCNRGTTLEQLEQLIDGPLQTEKCSKPTPSGPVWLLMLKSHDGSEVPVASLARFAVAGANGTSFDVFTVHPHSTDEENEKQPINDFISALTTDSRYRSTNPYYPTLVLGDFNTLIGTNWPSGTKQVFSAGSYDVMAVALGNNSSPLPSLHSLQMDLGMTLPTLDPCRPQTGGTPDGSDIYVDKSFSDHCGLLVRFTEQ